MAGHLQPLLASISVGRICGWSWAVAKALTVTVWNYVKVKAGACDSGRERTVEKSSALEGALLKSRGHSLSLQEWPSLDEKLLENMILYQPRVLTLYSDLTADA